MQHHTEVTTAMPSGQHYAFLSQPPPLNGSTRMAENARRRSATINAWASTVQPGAPAPISPSRLEPSSSELRASRRKSHTGVPMPAPPSPVAYIPEQDDSPTNSSHTITPTLKPDAKHDLPALGYTSIFVTLPPKTPPAEYTPDRRRSVTVPRSAAPVVPPTPNTPAGGAGKGFLRGLSIKHARSKSTVDGASSKSKSASASASAARDKKSKYADMRPPQISTDLALAQFMGGGSVEHHMKQYAKAQAKASGAAAKADGTLAGVHELHRDGRGGVWRDQDEELEYAGLLGESADGTGAGNGDWVQFDEERGVGAFDGARRASVDSDLDPRYAMQADGVDPFDASVPTRYLRKNVGSFPSVHGESPSSGKRRRRPEPLALVSSNTSHLVPASNPLDPAEARREFFESSFTPSSKPISSSPNPSSTTVDSYSKKSMLKGLFKSKKSSRA